MLALAGMCLFSWVFARQQAKHTVFAVFSHVFLKAFFSGRSNPMVFYSVLCTSSLLLGLVFTCVVAHPEAKSTVLSVSAHPYDRVCFCAVRV